MRRLIAMSMVAAALAMTASAQAAEKLRFGYAVQVHQSNMMIIGDYAQKNGVELEITPMRRYADLQLALMTNQLDVVAMGYVNVGLMEEKAFKDYRVVGGVFIGGQGLTLAKDVKASTWKD